MKNQDSGSGGTKVNPRPIIVLAVISMILCGLFFPLLITGIAQVVDPYQANGEIAQLHGHPVGSYLIDNGFTLPVFFHARNESSPLEASGSGVDPHITVQEAYSQVPRISNATGISASALVAIVNQNVDPLSGTLADPYVNVLALNLALINAFPATYSAYG